MNLLLDTHVWAWWLLGDKRLSASVLQAIEDPENEVYVSAICLWEVRLKAAIGKLDSPPAPIESTLAAGIQFLPFDEVHADAVGQLPLLHRDPFDRAILAQALASRLTLVTDDAAILRYPGIKMLRA